MLMALVIFKAILVFPILFIGSFIAFVSKYTNKWCYSLIDWMVK